jgi:hypothetical protein
MTPKDVATCWTPVGDPVDLGIGGIEGGLLVLKLGHGRRLLVDRPIGRPEVGAGLAHRAMMRLLRRVRVGY